MKLTKKQIWQIVGVCALVALMIAGTILGVVLSINFKPEVMQEIQPQESSPLVIEGADESGIMLTSGVATTASDGTTSQNIQATITPTSATKKSLTWSVAFNNPSSTWANGKTVTDYVSVSWSSSADTICTVTCAQAFGEQIILKCQSVDYPGIYATATVDYERKVDSVSLHVTNNHDYATSVNGAGRMRVVEDADTYTFAPSVSFNGTYTIYKEYTADLTWKIASSGDYSLFGSGCKYGISNSLKYNSTLVTTLAEHNEKSVTLSLDFLCEELFGTQFTQASAYNGSSADAVKNDMRSAVITGLNACRERQGYVISATVTCGGVTANFNYYLGEVNVSIPLEAVSLKTTALQF